MAELRQIALDIVSNSMEYNGEQAQILEELESATDADIVQFLIDNDYLK